MCSVRSLTYYLCAMFAHVLHPDDTIAAPATAAGTSALAVIRVSGPQAIAISDKVFRGKSLLKQNSHTVHYGHIVDGDEVIDEVMVTLFRAPRSFTSEDSTEISCHGSPYIQGRILQALLRHGARLATAGEFTMRAYLNGRIDLAQAEAVSDMIQARNASQLALAVNQMRGGLSSGLHALRTELLDFISLLELELDFGEEDVEFADRHTLKARLLQIKDSLRPLLDSFRYGNAIRNGIPVAIIGRPNAGKSSLLNALLNDERAIVSDIAGTTRDTIEEEIHIKGVAFRFIDTAGIRETADTIEKIGIEKAFRKIREASIVLYIYDATQLDQTELDADLNRISAENPSASILILANKMDLLPDDADLPLSEDNNHIALSLKTNTEASLQAVRESLWAFSQIEGREAGSAVISNERHYQCLLQADEALDQVLGLITGKASSDLLALEMKRAVTAIGDITGMISGDEVLGNIFGKFCIGK